MGISLRNPFYFKKEKQVKTSDDDDTISILRKQIKQKQKQLELERVNLELEQQRQEIMDMKEEYYDFDEEEEEPVNNPETLIYSLISKLLSKSESPTTTPLGNNENKTVLDVAELKLLSLPEVDAIINDIPPELQKKLISMRDEEIKKLTKIKYPDLDEANADLILKRFRETFK